MRIIGYIEHPSLKITVFKMDTRITVKFENKEFEQSFKFRMTNQLSHIKDVERLVDDQFIAGVNDQFKSMTRTKVQAMDRFVLEEGEEEFDVII